MERLLTLAEKAGFSQWGRLDMNALEVRKEVRDMCASDRCHIYGKSWSCPPACGSLEQCGQTMNRYQQGILVQTTAQLEDEFDMEGLAQAQKQHKSAFESLSRQVRAVYGDCLPLTAGTCTLCYKCTYPKKPCRFPQKRMFSMEAFGLLVSDVCVKSGLKYYYGPKTITYTSCILFDEKKGWTRYGNP